jgi:hypothetical protein
LLKDLFLINADHFEAKCPAAHWENRIKRQKTRYGRKIMNWMIFISGLAAGFVNLGHFTVGSKDFLKPMLQANFEDVPKKVMHCVFHYVSAYLVLSFIVLMAIGLGFSFGTEDKLLVRFIAINYFLFAITQIVIAAASNIPKGVIKLFQWIFFMGIAIFAWIGTS